MSKVLIRGGTLITADRTFLADVIIDGERISSIGQNLSEDDAEVIDATGKFILPGGVDPHVHLDLPMFDTVSSDDYYTGGKAAAFGGTTTVLDFVPQDYPTLKQSIQAWRRKSTGRASIDFGLHMVVSRFDKDIIAEIPSLIGEGITTLKVFTAYNNRLRINDGEIFQVMREAGKSGLLTLLHAENGDVIELLTEEALASGNTAPIWHARTRPAWGEAESVLRGIAIAEYANAPLYVVHLSTVGGLDHLNYGRKRGVNVMAETCPAYLFFTEADLEREDGAKWICSPPMRTKDDNEALWRGLEEDQIQVVATDHCPFFFDGSTPIEYEGELVAIPGKELGANDFTKIPNGLPGVGDRMPILWSYGVGKGRLTPNQFVALTSTNPAKIFGLYPMKGALKEGSDADIVIWDPELKISYGVDIAHHRTDYNLFEGWEIQGYPEKVFLRGGLIVNGDKWLGKAGMGRFLERKPFAEII
jgi:dihydropyrimidinase